jgi:tetratricopeptide (TPR) repeat protein
MRLGAALSDYAAAAPTLGEMFDRRQRAIAAYKRVIAIKGDYANALDAMGLQYSALNRIDDSKRAYNESLRVGETPAAHMDFGLLFIHGRNDSFDQGDIQQDELRNAANHFRKAIELSPDYWDAYGRLGYVYYRAGKLIDAVDVLETAVQHDKANRSLRLLLGSVYAGQCRFDEAKASFESAYKTYVKNKENDNALDVVSDWGKALAWFGLSDSAMAQETEVLAAKPTHVNALRVRGEIEIETSGMDPFKVTAGLADLKAAVDNDSPKTDNDPPKSDAVLSAYLEALVQTGRSADAVAAYEAWSRDGLVPPLATASTWDATIRPATPNTRMAYAKALLKNSEWQSASHEFAVLLQMGVRPEAQAGVEPARSAHARVDDAMLTNVSTSASDTTAGAARPERKHECTVLSMTQRPLLTDSASLLPAQELQVAAL